MEIIKINFKRKGNMMKRIVFAIGIVLLITHGVYAGGLDVQPAGNRIRRTLYCDTFASLTADTITVHSNIDCGTYSIIGITTVSGTNIVTNSLTVQDVGYIENFQDSYIRNYESDTVSGNLWADSFFGDGSGLTGIAAGAVALTSVSGDTITKTEATALVGDTSVYLQSVPDSYVRNYESDTISGDLTVAGELNVGSDIFRLHDRNTKIKLAVDRVKLNAGGLDLIDCHEEAQDYVNIGNTGLDVDVCLFGGQAIYGLCIEGATGRVSIGDSNHTDSVSIMGTVTMSDTLTVSDTVTASAFVGDGSQLTGVVADFTGTSGFYTRSEADSTFVKHSDTAGLLTQDDTAIVNGMVSTTEFSETDAFALADSPALITYYNNQFDTCTGDTYVGADSWSVSNDTLTLVQVWYKADSGVFSNVYRLCEGSPIDIVEEASYYRFLCITEDIDASDIKAVFRRK
jgi:hypothetical protein